MATTQDAAARKSRSLLGIYAYAVCFLSLLGIVIALVAGLYNGFEWLFPERTIFNYEQYLSNDEFWDAHKFLFVQPSADGGATSRTPVRPSEDELTKKRLEKLRSATAQARRNVENNLVKVVVWLIVVVPVFFTHRKIANRERIRIESA